MRISIPRAAASWVGPCAVLAFLSAGVAVQADLIVYEPFNYPVAWRDQNNTYGYQGMTNASGGGSVGLGGPTSNNNGESFTGWANYIFSVIRNPAVWQNGRPLPAPSDSQPALNVSVPAGTNYPTPTGNVGVSGWATRVYPRNLTTAARINPRTAGTYYSAQLTQAYDNQTASFSNIELRGSGLSAINLGGWIGDGRFEGGNASLLLRSTQTYNYYQTYLLVTKMEFDYDGNQNARFSFWINPNVMGTEASNAAALVGTNTTSSSYAGTTGFYDSLNLYGWSYGAYDEIRIGTAWSDLTTTPVPEPMAICLLAAGLGGSYFGVGRNADSVRRR